MMQHLSISALEDVRCPECRLTPDEVNAETINLLYNDPVHGSVVFIPEDTQPDGQPEEHELAAPAGQAEPVPAGQAEPVAAGQAEPSEAGTMTDGFLKVFHGPAFNFS